MVQDETISSYDGVGKLKTLNYEFPNLQMKASVCIFEAMSDEYANFDENSNC